MDKSTWDERLADIAHFEDYLTRQGVIILKFFLNVSRKEQKKRFMERLDKPEKHWKFSLPTCTSANSGATTCTPSRRRSERRHRSTRHGTWYRPQ